MHLQELAFFANVKAEGQSFNAIFICGTKHIQHNSGHPLPKGEEENMSSGPDNYDNQKRMIAEQIWLKYYNQVLFEKDMITEEEHNRMINRINARNSMIGSKNTPSISC